MSTGYSRLTGENPFKGKRRAPFTEEHKRKMSLAMKGRKAWNKGKKGVQKCSKATREKMSISHRDERHWAWKGDSVGYHALHRWVQKHLGTGNKCEHCKEDFSGRFIQWANKSGKYKRRTDDWIRLCARCHYKYDEEVLKSLHGYNRK